MMTHRDFVCFRQRTIASNDQLPVTRKRQIGPCPNAVLIAVQFSSVQFSSVLILNSILSIQFNSSFAEHVTDNKILLVSITTVDEQKLNIRYLIFVRIHPR